MLCRVTPGGWRSSSAIVVALALGVAPGVAPGAERHSATIQNVPGMPAAISDVAQDDTGFLWVTSAEGLFRFDGVEFVRRSEPVVLNFVTTGPDGRVVAGQQHRPWLEWDGKRTAPILGPDGGPIEDVQDALFERDGALWLLTSTRAWRRAASGGWSDHVLPAGSTGRSLAAHPAGGVLAGTRQGSILRLRENARPERLLDGLAGIVTHVVLDVRGAIVANVRWGPNAGVVRIERDRVERLLDQPGRPTGLALRGETIWSSWDVGVFAMRPGESPEFLSPRDGFNGGGNVRVDRERTLWVTSFTGELMRFPEPDTRVYTARSGLDHAQVRQVVRAGATYWASSWSGVLRYAPESDRWERFSATSLRLMDHGCTIATGDLLTAGLEVDPASAQGRGWLLRIHGDEVRKIAAPQSPPPEFLCTAAPDDGRWIAFGAELRRVSRSGEVRFLGRLPAAVAPAVSLAVAPDGALWAAGASGILCRSDGEASTIWDCVAPPGLGDVRAMAFVDRDTMWFATFGRGLLECDRSSCTPMPGSERIGTDEVAWLEPSPRGGVWVLSRSSARRVETLPTGPTIVEQLTPRQGLPRWWMASITEDPDGTLWVVGLAGIARIPASARGGDIPPPLVQPTHLAVSGRERPRDHAVTAVSGEDTIELHWAALSFRDPLALRYRFRLDPSLPWIDTESPRLVLVAPQPGHYRVEVAAALDPATWSVAPSVVDLQVVPPWYRRASFLAGIAVALVALVVAAYRLRVAHLLRLERQRTQIAMDLHDDIGSTLGGIGLLASLAGDERVEPDARRRALDRIADQTGTVASALADIVWSLRPGAETLDQLVLALRERAAELVPNGRIDLRFDLPDPPPRARLTLPVRRNVQWIAVEALRNAVRHGDPSRISVRLAAAGAAWQLVVEDDGQGMAEGPKPSIRGGMGLENMRRRAEAVRARLEVGRGESGGAQVALLFRPDGRAP